MVRGRRGHPILHVVTLSRERGDIAARETRIRAKGRLVHRLPEMGDEVLWAVPAPRETAVYRLRIGDLLGEEEPSLDEVGTRVPTLEYSVAWWVADRRGVVRAALRGATGLARTVELLYRPSAAADWGVLVEAEDPEEVPRPLGIAGNDRDLIVAARGDHDTWALHELSGKTGELGRELFSDPDVDVVGVIYDYSGADVIGVVCEREGLEEYHHFDAFHVRYQRSLEHAFPGRAGGKPPLVVLGSRNGSGTRKRTTRAYGRSRRPIAPTRSTYPCCWSREATTGASMSTTTTAC